MATVLSLLLESAENKCYGSGQAVKFCAEDQVFHFPDVTVPHYILLLATFIIIVLILRFPLRRLLITDAKTKRNVTLVSLWATLFLGACCIWISTVYWVGGSIYFKALRVFVAIMVLPSIWMIEGLGLAVIELEDKEIPEKIGRLNVKQAHDIMNDYLQDTEAYLRAREWCLAGLIILLTTDVEFEKYHVPYIGTFEGSLVRSIMTVALAVVAVIWIAQAPAKELGRENPVKFLNMRIGPGRVNRIILGLSRLAKSTSINDPSDVTAGFLAGLLPVGGEPPLPPGGTRFFAELIRRYGYGDCEVIETYTIKSDGSADLVQIDRAYLGRGKEDAYVRLVICDVTYAEKPVVVSKKAFVVSALSESLERDMEAWKNGENIISHVTPRLVKTRVDLLAPETGADGTTKQTAKITAVLPKNQLEEDQGFVLEVETHAKLPPGSFKSTAIPGEDSWVRRLSKPCYRAVTKILLAPDTKQGAFENIEFEVNIIDLEQPLPHPPELARFAGLQREEDLKNTEKGHPTLDGVSADGKSLTIKLTYGLPGGHYWAKWDMTSGESNPADQLVPPPVMMPPKVDTSSATSAASLVDEGVTPQIHNHNVSDVSSPELGSQ